MDRQGIRSKRDDNRHETILELTSTGNGSEVLPTGADEVGEGSRMIRSTSSKDAGHQSLLTPGEQRSDELEGGETKSSGRQNSKSKKVKGKGKKDGFGEKRGAMMVVSVLIATLTYQAALNPPGGFWQDDQAGSASPPPPPHGGYSSPSTPPPTQLAGHEAGTAINREFPGFQYFLIANTVGLFSSLVIIMLLSSAITIRRPIMMWLLMFIMWVSVFSVAFSFCMGVLIILRRFTDPAVIYIGAFVSCCVVLFVLLVILHIVVGLKKICRWAKKKPSHGEEV